MPWEPSEATNHTKAAKTPKKQRQWAHVANSMLKKTKNEGKAIRAANAAVSGDALDTQTVKEFCDAWSEASRVASAEARRRETERRKKQEEETKKIIHAARQSSPIGSVVHSANSNYVAPRFIRRKKRDEDMDDDGRRKKTKRDPRGRVISTETEEDDGVEPFQIVGSVETDEIDAWSEAARAAALEARRKHGKGTERGEAHAERKMEAHLVSSGWEGVDEDEQGWSIYNKTEGHPSPDQGSDWIRMKGSSWEHKEDLTGMGKGKVLGSGKGGASLAEYLKKNPTAGHRTYPTKDGIKDGALSMYDTIDLDDAAKVNITRDGYLKAMPRIARVGIQLYAGSECGDETKEEVRVYRPESSVFAPDAVHTYTHLPITVGHPKVLVTSKNWRDHAVGDTGDEVLRDGGTVRVPMMLRDAAAIKTLRDKNQLSVGYTCDLDWTAGVTADGEQYDAVQTNIRANHLAIVAAARGGSSLRVGDDQQQHTEDTMQLKNVMVDGIECQMTDTAASLVQRTIQRLTDQVENFKKKKKEEEEEKDSLDETIRKRDEDLKAKDAQIAVLTQQVKDAQDPAKLGAAINDRLGVFTRARAIMGDTFKVDGKSITDVRREVVNAKANLGEATKAWGDAEYKAAFEMLSAGAGKSSSGGITDARNAFSRPHFAVADDREKAYADREKEDAEAWRTGGVQKSA